MVSDDFISVIRSIKHRLAFAIDKHGDWSHYTVDQVKSAVVGEVEEFLTAWRAGVLVGKHGQIDELCDVAVVAIKGIRQLVRLSRVLKKDCRDEGSKVYQVQQGPPCP